MNPLHLKQEGPKRRRVQDPKGLCNRGAVPDSTSGSMPVNSVAGALVSVSEDSADQFN